MSSESFARIGFGRINGSSGNVRSHTFELDSKRFFFVCILFAQVNCAQLILIGCERFKFEFRFGFKFGSKLAERCNEPMQIRLMAGTQQASLWCVLSGSLLKKSISDIGNNDYYYYYYSLARLRSSAVAQQICCCCWLALTWSFRPSSSSSFSLNLFVRVCV